jgi:hypothetical protein
MATKRKMYSGGTSVRPRNPQTGLLVVPVRVSEAKKRGKKR